MRLAMAQMPVTASIEKNLATAAKYVRRAAAGGAQLVVLPEMFSSPYQSSLFPAYAQPKGGQIWQAMSALAKEAGVVLVAGSMAEVEDGRYYNTSFVFDEGGRQLARHRKIHLFDIDVKGGQRFFESETLTAGSEITVFDCSLGRFGLCICFDLRFPELMGLMALSGAQAILAPAAFNMTTGPAHWETTLRQRAVDCQLFTVAVSPARDPDGSYVAYGNSMACSPWGTVLERAAARPTLRFVELALEENTAIRSQLPLLSARRTDLYRLEALPR